MKPSKISNTIKGMKILEGIFLNKKKIIKNFYKNNLEAK